MAQSYFTTSQVAASVPFDNTGLSYNATDVQASLLELRQHPVMDQDSTATTAAGTLTLTSTSKGFQLLTGTASGYIVKMPDATTIFVGQNYEITNTSSQPMTIKDGNSGTLFTLSQNSIGYLRLQTAGSVAGTWVYWQTTINTSSGITTYNVVSSTTFASTANVDTLITGMTVTPVAGTYAVWYNAQNSATGSGAQLDCTVFKGGSAIADSKRSNLSTTGTHIFQNSTQTITQFDGTQTCEIRVNANGNSMTIAQRSMLLVRLGP